MLQSVGPCASRQHASTRYRCLGSSADVQDALQQYFDSQPLSKQKAMAGGGAICCIRVKSSSADMSIQLLYGSCAIGNRI